MGIVGGKADFQALHAGKDYKKLHMLTLWQTMTSWLNTCLTSACLGEKKNNDMKEENNELDNNLDHTSQEIAVEDTSQNPSADKSENLQTDETETAESEFRRLQAEAADWKDKYIRLYAEFENFRQRTSKEKINLIATASEGLMLELLPVVDDFERSIKAMEQASDVQSLREGVELVFHKLIKTLNQKGLKPMDSIGQVFNADLHEAITQIPAPDPAGKGKVIDEIEKGYTLHDKPIRYAKVVIGS
jgi:molecular chaperone GrpE